MYEHLLDTWEGGNRLCNIYEGWRLFITLVRSLDLIGDDFLSVVVMFSFSNAWPLWTAVTLDPFRLRNKQKSAISFRRLLLVPKPNQI